VSAIAVLGLGAMGAAIAAKLRAEGHDLTVWNRTSGRDEELVAGGARRAGTPAEAVEDAEVVITVLTDPPALERVLFGPDGAGHAMAPDATLIDMSTVGPTAIGTVIDRVAPVDVIDAPVLGSVPSVETGSLVILVGGDREVFDRHAGLLGVLGTAMYVGPSGSGAWLKLVNNAASIATLVALGELLAVTDRAGLEAATVLDSLEAGPLASLIVRWRPRLLEQDTSSNFRLALARKDLEIAFEEAARLDRRLTVDETAAARSDEAIEAGLGDEDFGAVVGFLRR
jgi:3-hydroxyisobutyrate dehydrogenase